MGSSTKRRRRPGLACAGVAASPLLVRPVDGACRAAAFGAARQQPALSSRHGHHVSVPRIPITSSLVAAAAAAFSRWLQPTRCRPKPERQRERSSHCRLRDIRRPRCDWWLLPLLQMWRCEVTSRGSQGVEIVNQDRRRRPRARIADGKKPRALPEGS